MPVRLFCHTESELSNGSRSPEEVAEYHTNHFLKEIKKASPEATFDVTPIELSDRAQVHCDKWVEDVGTHFSLYSAAMVPSLDFPVIGAPMREVMKHKVYSGDVSGTIGEALFSILITKHFGLGSNAFAHLRADKATGLYPDFAIFDPTPSLRARLEWSPSAKLGRFPTPAEVKTVSYPMKAQTKPQLRKAVQQIRNYWIRRNVRTPVPSMICLAFRNQGHHSYDLGVIWGI